MARWGELLKICMITWTIIWIYHTQTHGTKYISSMYSTLCVHLHIWISLGYSAGPGPKSLPEEVHEVRTSGS